MLIHHESFCEENLQPLTSFPHQGQMGFQGRATIQLAKSFQCLPSPSTGSRTNYNLCSIMQCNNSFGEKRKSEWCSHVWIHSDINSQVIFFFSTAQCRVGYDYGSITLEISNLKKKPMSLAPPVGSLSKNSFNLHTFMNPHCDCTLKII